MVHRLYTFLLLLCGVSAVEAVPIPAVGSDSLRTTDIEEIVVVATPKEGERLRRQPLASSSFSQERMSEQGVLGIKDLSSAVPNLFIPSYGSHLTTSVYVRGIGSRTGTPAVALYVDGIPQVSAASYDFNFSNVDRIDVLRGPQSTLYGRNSMGGVIRVYTKNPMQYQGSDLSVDASHVVGASRSGRDDGGGMGRYRLNLTHYHRVSDRFAFSAHFFGDVDGGYFRNEARGDERMDDQTDLGARMRFIYKPKQDVNLDITLSHEWLRQGGYPYEYRGAVGNPTTPDPQTAVGHIAYDHRSSYRRNLTHAGLTAERLWPTVALTSTTGFQHLHDCMNLDQDFTDCSLYTLMQRQNTNTLSEELLLKPRTPLALLGSEWSPLSGVSAIRQWNTVEGPVTFHADGLAWLNSLVNGQGNAHLPTVTSHDDQGAEEYTMNFVFNNQILGSELPFPGTYQTPATNVALFHQSTFSRLFGVERLAFTAGLRLDYEYFSLDHDAAFSFGQSYGLEGRLTYPDGHVREGMPLVPVSTYMVADRLEGKLSKDYLELLPRFTLQYTLDNGMQSSHLYATLSSGYRSGGYNVQMFSDLLQTQMQTDIMHNVANATVPVVDAVTMIPSDVKQEVRDMLIGMGTMQPTDVQAATWYKPERSWNYELGSHLNLLHDRLLLDISAFWMETRNQQITKMSTNGLGRLTVNSGRSRSRGVEVSANSQPTNRLRCTLSYGYLYARLRHTADQPVPFVPEHTLSVGATQTWPLSHPRLTAILLHADYQGCGRLYWSDTSLAKQDFAGQLNARLTFRFRSRAPLTASSVSSSGRQSSLSFWATNILSTRYQTFYFETMQRGFAQYTRPVTIGLQFRHQF